MGDIHDSFNREVIYMWIINAIGKWSLLFLSFSLGTGFLIALIFSLMKAGRKADEAEEKLLEILSPARPVSNVESESMQTAEVSVAR
jgi:hypothetical protein